MKFSGRLTALVIAIVAITGASMTIAQAGAMKITTPAAAPVVTRLAVDPTAASRAIGKPPRVDSPAKGRPPSVLGTVFGFRWVHTAVDVRVTSVDTTTVDGTAPSRHIRVTVNYTATLGTVTYATTEFAIIDDRGTRYAAAVSGTSSGPLPQLGTGTLTAPATTNGVLLFDIPTTADALVIGYVPAPSHSVVGTWMLSSP